MVEVVLGVVVVVLGATFVVQRLKIKELDFVVESQKDTIVTLKNSYDLQKKTIDVQKRTINTQERTIQYAESSKGTAKVANVTPSKITEQAKKVAPTYASGKASQPTQVQRATSYSGSNRTNDDYLHDPMHPLNSSYSWGVDTSRNDDCDNKHHSHSHHSSDDSYSSSSSSSSSSWDSGSSSSYDSGSSSYDSSSSSGGWD